MCRKCYKEVENRGSHKKYYKEVTDMGFKKYKSSKEFKEMQREYCLRVRKGCIRGDVRIILDSFSNGAISKEECIMLLSVLGLDTKKEIEYRERRHSNIKYREYNRRMKEYKHERNKKGYTWKHIK